MPKVADEDAQPREVEAWRQSRYARLQEPMSWLTLVALEWLDEGENRLGSGADAELRLPSGPPLAGRLVRHGLRATAQGEPGAPLTHEGRPVNGLELVSDADAPEDEGPTLLEVGRLRMCLIRRGDRLGLRVWDTESPSRQSFRGIPHYPVDPAWRVAARFEPAAPGETIAVPDVLGTVENQPLPGAVAFEAAGVTHRLQALVGGEDRLWLVFSDQTNGDTTYAGGRFVYTDPPGADGTVIVDFNRAYNPPCVFSQYATCPLPPAGNRLPVRVEAGEQLPK